MNKVLSLTSVKHATLLLIEANEKTTTLEVKGVLRDLGYEADQANVSEFMSQAADELPLEFSNGGRFRVYSLPTPASLVAPSTPANIVPATPATTSNVVPVTTRNHIVSYTKRDRSVIVGTRSIIATTPGDWSVVNGSHGPLYFDGGLTRDEVRQAYASINDVDFHNTRSSRIK